ncbi:MAG: hypothetical protein HYZ75_09045 [Elusimicrobia bacterium]|nr:hypothetical protein [Elusimicrobiota bacterium]
MQVLIGISRQRAYSIPTLPTTLCRLLALLACLQATASAAPARRKKPPVPAQGLVISSIVIETHNVFDTDDPRDDKLVYRAANRFHRTTRDQVISRELLFAEGDRYDQALVEESARNLRALPFIRDAAAAATVNKKGTVDVVMRTYDSWTLEVLASFKRAGGSTNLKAGLSEHNVLGSGKAGSASYNRDGKAGTQSLGFKDPQFFNRKRLQVSLTALTAPGAQDFELGVDRPFTSLSPSAFGGKLSHQKGDFSTAANPTPADMLTRKVSEGGINYGIALATSTQRTRRVRMGLMARRADFRPIPGQTAGPIPSREQATFLQLGADWEELDFITVRRIQKFTRTEDYNLGLAVFPELAWAPPSSALGTTETQILPKVVVRKGFVRSNQLILLSSAYSSRYVNGGNGHRLASFEASYFVRGLKYQTLAFHTGLDLGRRLDSTQPLALGEVNGLRGYGLDAFKGDRRFLFNIEDRIFIYDEMLRLLDVGAVVFYDSGYVWPSSRSVKLSELRNSVGLGLRLAPSRSAGNDPVRVDLAYALNDNRSRSRWSLSILAGQAFK